MATPTVWNFTVDDSAAMVNYAPFGDGGLFPNLKLGWFPFYNKLEAKQYGESGLGLSLHVTQLSGASFKIGPFYGSAIYVYGSTNATFDVDIDSQPEAGLSAGSDDLIYVKDGLPNNVHYLTLTTHTNESANEQFAFDYAVISQQLSAGQDEPVAVEYWNTDSALVYTGSWAVVPNVVPNNTQIPNSTDPLPYHKTTAAGSSVLFNFTGIGVAINGSRNWGSWAYSVSVDDNQPTQFNASTVWLVPDSLLYFSSGFDPGSTHTINVTYSGPTESYYSFDLNSITVFESNVPGAGAAKSSKINIGAIVGAVIGGIAGLVLVLLAFFFWRRRRNGSALGQDSVVPFPTEEFDPQRLVSIGKAEAAASSGTLTTLPTLPGGAAGRTYFEKERAPVQQTASPPTTLSSASRANAAPPSMSGESQGQNLGSLPTQTSVASVVPPSSASVPAPAAQNSQIDVNRIIELIADRIDSARDPYNRNAPPPQYPTTP